MPRVIGRLGDDVRARMEHALMRLARHLQPIVPLLAIDLEGTGPYPDRDRITEIGVAKYTMPDHERQLPDGRVTTWASLINPGCPIPAEVSKKTGITDAMVAEAPRFEQIAAGLAERFDGCVFVGYNLRGYDLPILKAEFARAGVAYDPEKEMALDPFRIWQEKERRTLAAAVLRFTGQEMTGTAHEAGTDVAGALEALVGQCLEWRDLPKEITALAAFCNQKPAHWIDPAGRFKWVNGVAVVDFSDHRGTPLAQVDPGFLRWMLTKDFPEPTKQIASDALDGIIPPPPEDADAH
jgi:DNA polymerase-3 subunit epsilon